MCQVSQADRRAVLKLTIALAVLAREPAWAQEVSGATAAERGAMSNWASDVATGTLSARGSEPVEAGLVREPFAWPWSSAAATAGLAPPPVPLELGPIREVLGDRPGWQRQYQAFIAASWAT